MMSVNQFLDFYANEFQNCVNACKVTNLSKEIVSTLQEKGYTVAIATNPIFPQIATYSRLNWLHIDPESLPWLQLLKIRILQSPTQLITKKFVSL